MGRPKKQVTPEFKPDEYLDGITWTAPELFANVLRRVDTGEQIEAAAKHLLRKAADGDDWAISLVADLLRENNGLG